MSINLISMFPMFYVSSHRSERQVAWLRSLKQSKTSELRPVDFINITD